MDLAKLVDKSIRVKLAGGREGAHPACTLSAPVLVAHLCTVQAYQHASVHPSSGSGMMRKHSEAQTSGLLRCYCRTYINDALLHCAPPRRRHNHRRGILAPHAGHKDPRIAQRSGVCQELMVLKRECVRCAVCSDGRVERL